MRTQSHYLLEGDESFILGFNIRILMLGGIGKKEMGIGLMQLSGKKRVTLLAAVIAVLSVAIILLAVLLSTGQKSGNDHPTLISKEEFEKQTEAERNDNAQSSAMEALDTGNNTDAATVYENAIAAEKDPGKKVELAADQSRLLLVDGQQNEAIAVLKKAIEYNSDKYRIYDLLGHTYEQVKLYSEAATYYEKAGLLVDSPTNIGQFTKTYYDNRVVKLKALAG